MSEDTKSRRITLRDYKFAKLVDRKFKKIFSERLKGAPTFIECFYIGVKVGLSLRKKIEKINK